jgi:TldD protein
VKGVPKSTGSFQGSGPAPRNLIVSAAQGLAPGALKAELLRAVQQRGKEYGVIVRRLGDPLVGGNREASAPASGDGVRVEPAILAYKVFPDGREELLRNVEVGAMNVSLFKDILAAGQEPSVLTVPFRTTASPSAQVVSFAVPSLLFEDVTLKKPGGEIPKPQVARHPFFDK